MRDIRCGYRPHELETTEVLDALEQSLAVAEKHGNQVNLHFVDQASAQVLPGGAPPTRERYIQPPRGAPRQLERCRDAIGYKREGRSALERERRAGVVRKHEYRVVKWRIGAPPTVPRPCAVPRARVAAEHV